MIARIVVLAIVLAQTSVPAQVRNAELELAVYRAALRGMPLETQGRHALIGQVADPSGIWSNPELIKDTPYLHPRNRITGATPETIDAFLSVVKSSENLPDSLRSLPDALVVDAREARRIGPWGWDKFEKRHGLAQGVISLSKIGFDASRSEALLYAAYVCGSLCGYDMFIQLNRNAAGGWTVTQIYSYGEF